MGDMERVIAEAKRLAEQGSAEGAFVLRLLSTPLPGLERDDAAVVAGSEHLGRRAGGPGS